MNFLARNLGWILLLCFFLFMLFLIAGQGNNNTVNQSITATGITSSGEESSTDSLDILINQIENTEEVDAMQGSESQNIESDQGINMNTQAPDDGTIIELPQGLHSKTGAGLGEQPLGESRGLFGLFGRDRSQSGGVEKESSDVSSEQNSTILKTDSDLVENNSGTENSTFEETSQVSKNESGEISDNMELEKTSVKELGQTDNPAVAVSSGSLENGKENEEGKEDIEAGGSVGFFSRIFGSRSEDSTSDIGVAENLDTTSSDETKSENGTQNEDQNAAGNTQDTVTDSMDYIISSGNQTIETPQAGYVKQTRKNEVVVDYSYAPEVKQTYSYDHLPGIHLETAIGNSYELGVHSLKLNNKYFNETLGYIHRGDVVQQITDENSYGCFKVEVVHAKNNQLIGKQGYVCKKWFQNYRFSEKGSIETMLIHNEIQSATKAKKTHTLVNETNTDLYEYFNVPKTTIGDRIVIEKSVTIDGVELAVGDTLDQMTDPDIFCCYMARVHQTSFPKSQDMLIKVCPQNIIK